MVNGTQKILGRLIVSLQESHNGLWLLSVHIMLENGDYLTFDQSDYEYEDGEVTALRKVIVNKMNDIFMNFVGACHVSLFKPFLFFFGQNIG